MLIKSFLAAKKVLEPRCGKFRQKNSFVCVLEENATLVGLKPFGTRWRTERHRDLPRMNLCRPVNLLTVHQHFLTFEGL
jgi:hypothetical protein